jgi:CopA family copper-resistance protein
MMKNLATTLSVLATLLFAGANTAEAKTVRYELTATRGEVNLSGKKTVDFALMLNGSIPAPTLELTEGDDAEIVVKNQIPGEELSVHWHGILLPPEMDGVAYVNTPPIHPGQSFTFKYRIRQNGTYWYHSHTNVQEQKGLYGGIVIHPKEKKIKADREVVAVISDWSDENANDILKNLRKDGDFYLYKKGTMRSYLGAVQAGGLGTYLDNEWTRMGGMDYSDVGYDAFLINGKKDLQLTEAHPGEKVRIRIINAGASSYFHVSLGQTPMQVISADGIDIQPTLAKEFLIGMAETYDVLFTVPEHKNYELRVTAQDGTGVASGWIGRGPKVPAPVKPLPDMYAPMDHGSGHGDHSEHGATSNHAGHPQSAPDSSASKSEEGHSRHGSEHGGDQARSKTDSAQAHHGHHAGHGSANAPSKDHPEHSGHSMANGSHEGHGQHGEHAAPPNGEAVDTLTVDTIRAQSATAFPKNAKTYDLKLELDGDMERYIWHINGKAIHEERTLEINEGDVVSFTFVNKTMMHHPMHLHGHFFRVVNKFGDYSPLKHTVDVPPHGTRKIEFLANEPGEWMLHCHNLYHMKTGMARVVKYSSYKPKPELANQQSHDPHLHDHWYTYGTAEAATNHAEGYFRLSQTWSEFEARVETRNSAGKNFSFGEPWEVEGDLFYRRWFNRFFNIVGGGTYFNESPRATVGVSYLLPILVESQLLVDHKGQFRLDLEKRFQWTSTIFTDAEMTWRPAQKGDIEEPFEFEVTLMYGPRWSWAAGLMLTEDAFGAGAQFQF